jgi:hypothetical protein
MALLRSCAHSLSVLQHLTHPDTYAHRGALPTIKYHTLDGLKDGRTFQTMPGHMHSRCFLVSQEYAWPPATQHTGQSEPTLWATAMHCAKASSSSSSSAAAAAANERVRQTHPMASTQRPRDTLCSFCWASSSSSSSSSSRTRHSRHWPLHTEPPEGAGRCPVG